LHQHGENIPNKLSKFDFIFIDSVSKGKVNNNTLNELIKSNPKTAFIFIFHSTKEGDFKGGQENAHSIADITSNLFIMRFL
jgi:hypothetical protein